LDLEVRQRLLGDLCASDERFFGWTDDIHVNASSIRRTGVDPELVGAGDRTLETGGGYSMVAFELASASHTVVAPFEPKQRPIRMWCADHGVNTLNVRFVVGRSQHVLPALESTPLDFGLVDGDHAFPTPFIDWYYSAERLRVGGLVMIEDIPLRTGAVLDEFLNAETPRWRAVSRLPRTVVYEKLTSTVIDFAGWMSQPWCMRNPSVLGRVRDRVRLRTRLRAALTRLGH
jgi:hypothetical protein